MRALVLLLSALALIAPRAALALDPAKVPPITLGSGSAGDATALGVTANGATQTLGAMLGVVQGNTSAITGEASRAAAAEALLAPKANPVFTGTATAPALLLSGSGSTGDVSKMSIYPGVAPLLRSLKDRAGDEIRLEDYCTGLSVSGVDVTSCLQSAVNAAAMTGRCLTLPPTPSAAVYWTLSATISIGNGSTSAASTIPGVCIQGAGSGGLFGQRGTYFRWGGAAGGTMFQISGPIENVKLRGFNANGANVAGRIINAGAIRFSEFRDIFATAFTRVGIGTYGIASNGALNFMLDWSGLYVTTNQPSAIAVDFDGVLANNTDTWLSTVRNSRLESFGTNGRALRLAYSDNILFSQLHAVVKTNGVIPSGGCAVLFDATTSGTGGNSFPTGHHFLKSAIDNTCTSEDASHTIGVSTFADYGTTDNEVIPTHPNLRGITDQGFSFNGYGGPATVTYTPTLSATTPGATPPTFSNVSFRYAISGRVLTISGSFTVATRGTGSGNIVIPLPTGITAGGLQAMSAVNGSTGAVWYGVAQGTALQTAFPAADGQVFAVSTTILF